MRIDLSQNRPAWLLEVIQGWKDAALSPAQAARLPEAASLAGGKLPDLYERYQERLLALNACDFADLILHPVAAFRKDEELLEGWRRRFRYLLVDEYQDVNGSQYLWMRLLGSGHRNVCVVGDDDQSIYSWRGADVGKILSFARDFPGAKEVRLEENYRSQPRILRAAMAVVSANHDRSGKTLYSKGEAGEPVRVGRFWDDKGEAAWISEEIAARARQGLALGKAAVLVRTSAQLRELEERFIADALPYRRHRRPALL